MARENPGFSTSDLLLSVFVIVLLGVVGVREHQYQSIIQANEQAKNNLMRTVIAQEAAYMKDEAYVNDVRFVDGFDFGSQAVTVILGSTPSSWRGSSYHPGGSKTYCFDSGSSTGIMELPGTGVPCP